MSNSFDSAAEEPASTVSASLTEQMLHLTNRFEEERLKLEERAFSVDLEDLAEHAGRGDDEEG
jgi:hypothetical protein